MTKHLSVKLILALFLGSCGPVPAVPMQTVVATITQTDRLFTPTFISTNTPIPAVTPLSTSYPPLQTQGPYILFTRDHKNLTIMDADGIGRKLIQIPNNGYIFQLSRSISPDGRWLAYFTGSIKERYDITLNLLKLSDEDTQPVFNLLASDFPENLEPIVETMSLGDPPVFDPDCFKDMECRRSRVQRELTDSIYSLDWSPDSQTIAFIAQIDGPSSDIYLYSLQDKTVRQLTDEPENIYWLDWAPSGEKILYEISSTPGTGYEGRTLHIADLEGTTVFIDDEHLYQLRWGENDWLTENIYVLDHPNDTDKPPIYDLMTVDTETGQFKEIWPDSVEYFVINKENQTIVLAHRNHRAWPATIPEGIYMVYSSGEYRKISDIAIPFILKEGQGPYPVMGEDYGWNVYIITSNGSIEKPLWGIHGIPWVSPDGKLLLFKEDRRLALYKDSNEFIKSWDLHEGLYNITWSPDSQGMFIFTDVNAYYQAVSADSPRPLLENCSPKPCETTRFIWLP